jgi:hypothetical protein
MMDNWETKKHARHKFLKGFSHVIREHIYRIGWSCIVFGIKYMQFNEIYLLTQEYV